MKRPLVWIMAAYVLGIISYKYKIVAFIPLIALSYTLLFLFFRCEFWKLKKEKYLSFILLLLPFLFLLGNLRMNNQLQPSQIETVVDKKMKATMIGSVDQIQCYETSNAIVLKDVKIQLETSNDIYNCKKAIVYVSNETSIQYGNILSIQGSIYPLTRASNQGQFDQYLFYKAKDISIRAYATEIKVLDDKKDNIKQTLYEVKERFKISYETMLPKKEAGVLTAMLLGDKALLGEDIQETYQENGISHIISISGLHMSFFGLTIYHLLRKLKCRLVTATMVVFVLLILYGVLTNNSVSANRAIWMLILLLLATILGKTYDVLSALSFSALITLLQSPMQVFHVSFLLSYGAMIGIAVIYQVFRSCGLISKKPILKGITEGLFLSISAQIITFPIITYFFYEFSSYSIVINLFVVPLLSILFPMAVLGGIISLISLPIANICIGSSYYILIFYEKLCTFAQQLPYHLYLFGQPSMFQMLFFYFLVLVIGILSIKFQKKRIALLFLLCPLLFFIRKSEFQITMLDVGQGECIVIQNENGNVYMIDGGSTDIKGVGEKRIIPYLKSLGVNRIKCAFLTHSDADHINGVIEILTAMEDVLESDIKGDIKGNKSSYSGDIFIESICLPELSDYNDKYKEIVELSNSKGVEVRFYKNGEGMVDGRLKLLCLAPEEELDLSDTNSHSLVFWLRYGEFDALFTGDIDAAGELRVMKNLEELEMVGGVGKRETLGEIEELEKTEGLKKAETLEKAEELLEDYLLDKGGFELLKISHHGSKYSSNIEFLSYLAPVHSIISSGKYNTYGHPHKEAIDSLNEVSTSIHQTSLDGAITIYSDGAYMRIRHYFKREE